MPRWKHTAATVPVPAAGLRVGIVADTHSAPHPALPARIAALDPALLLHAGDIGRDDVIDELEELRPTFAVRGNIDGNARPDSILLDFLAPDGARVLRLLLLHIAVYGPRLRKDAATRARRHGAQLVVCGHSHVPLIAKDRGLYVFNPGSVGPRRFQLPITLGVLTLSPDGAIDLWHVDCETGERWSPAA